MLVRRLILSAGMAAVVSLSLVAASKDAAAGRTARAAQPTCTYPQSNADALVILANYYPGYWWDHTDLTIAVQPHPKATAAQVEAIRSAIATWSAVLEDCFDGAITLTDVTGTQPSAQRAADIVVHFVPTAGGVVNYTPVDSPDLRELIRWARSSTPKEAVFQFADVRRGLQPGILRARAVRASDSRRCSTRARSAPVLAAARCARREASCSRHSASGRARSETKPMRPSVRASAAPRVRK